MQTVSLGEAQPWITVSCCLKCLEQAAGVVWGAVGCLFAQANRPVAIIVLQFVQQFVRCGMEQRLCPECLFIPSLKMPLRCQACRATNGRPVVSGITLSCPRGMCPG